MQTTQYLLQEEVGFASIKNHSDMEVGVEVRNIRSENLVFIVMFVALVGVLGAATVLI